MAEIILVDGVFQDGGIFYRESGDNALIADYSRMLANDHDMAGAIAARDQFAIDYPEYVL
jgi:hypothetical protein